MLKIKKIYLKGIRGVKSSCCIDLNEQSILLYGESGTGKSSIADVFEWFYYDKIDHLSGEEISHSGILEALRNISLGNDEKSLVSIEFNNSSLNSEKAIYFKKDSLSSEYSNKSTDFMDLLKEFQKENFILRHEDLTEFVLSPKGKKLEYLSDIIGFSEITRIKSILKKSFNELDRTAKIKNYDNLIQTQQSHLLEHLGQNIVSEQQFINSINDLINLLNLNSKIIKLDDIGNILNSIKTPDNSKKINLQSFYVKVQDFASNLKDDAIEIKKSYKSFYDQYQKILTDFNKFQKVVLVDLLSEGQRILRDNIFTEDRCPLCLQLKNRTELLKELDIRIKELEIFNNEKKSLEESRTSLKKDLNNFYPLLNSILTDNNFDSEDNNDLKEMTGNLKKQFINYLTESEADISKLTSIKKPDELDIDENILTKIINFSEEKTKQIISGMGNNLILDISSKIHLSNIAYKQIKQLKKEKDILDFQVTSMRLVYREFVRRQQEGLKSFLTLFSKDINDLYQFMNPGEKVDEIELIPLEKDDELTGITLQLQFFKNKIKPPHKYLSESHLNCLGIAFFLTSVKAFNNKIGFLIIDDVISSFDSGHRTRFADLLTEKFADFQIILLTHEKNWFDYVDNSIKGKKWVVGSIKWNDERGTHLEDPPKNLKDRIENNIENCNDYNLGNDIRKYLEFLLKQIAVNLKIRVEFRLNNKNENRMSYELITCLLSEINKQPYDDLKSQLVIKRLLNSLFVGTKDSHDSSFIPVMGDYKAFWDDVEELENLFFCNSCQKFVSLDYYNKVANRIRCNCQKKNYAWKL